jgi:hypothetical protein
MSQNKKKGEQLEKEREQNRFLVPFAIKKREPQEF